MIPTVINDETIDQMDQYELELTLFWIERKIFDEQVQHAA